jgi:hypothetical protein
MAYILTFFALTDDMVGLLEPITDKKKVEGRLTEHLDAFLSGITGDHVSGTITHFSGHDYGQRWRLSPCRTQTAQIDVCINEWLEANRSQHEGRPGKMKSFELWLSRLTFGSGI